MQTRITGLESGSANFSAPRSWGSHTPSRFTHLVNGAIKYLAEHLPWALTDMPAGKHVQASVLCACFIHVTHAYLLCTYCVPL